MTGASSLPKSLFYAEKIPQMAIQPRTDRFSERET
jgi:hypothetical protein